jgi:hypothetical protein
VNFFLRTQKYGLEQQNCEKSVFYAIIAREYNWALASNLVRSKDSALFNMSGKSPL